MILYKKLKMIFFILILDFYNNLNNYLQSMDYPAPMEMLPSVAGHGSETPSTASRPTSELDAGRAPPPRPFSQKWFQNRAWGVVVGKEGHPPYLNLDEETINNHPLRYQDISKGWSCYNLDVHQERAPVPLSPISLALRDDVPILDPPSLDPPSLADRDAKPPGYNVCNLPDCVAGECVCSVA